MVCNLAEFLFLNSEMYHMCLSTGVDAGKLSFIPETWPIWGEETKITSLTKPRARSRRDTWVTEEATTFRSTDIGGDTEFN